MKFAVLPITAAALLLSACGQSGLPLYGPALPIASSPHRIEGARLIGYGPSRGKIKHIVILVQENRSLNDLFYGFPHARTVSYGYDSKDNKIELRPLSLATWWDIDHSASSFIRACDGSGSIPGTNCRMNGFDLEPVGCGMGHPSCPFTDPQYSFVPHSETKPYFDIASQYVLADEMYASNFDASSFVSHQYIIAGQAQSSINYPVSLWGCPGGPGDTIGTVGQQRQFPTGYETVCWDPTTLGDELDKARVSWAFYTATIKGDEGIWSAYQAINHIYNGPDWSKDVLTPQTQFFDDVSNGKLRSVSWITPTWENSDHAGNKSTTGPSWVASVVNAIGQSKYWNSTALFIFWDDYGGWYDPKPPAYVDYDGLGVRIPMLIVSAYAKKGGVSHVHYEHGSILKFVEDTFGLARLAPSDTRANSPARDAFNFKDPPRPFVRINSPYGEGYFKRQPTDHRVPDAE